MTPEEARDADEMFCTGTMGEIAPVIALDGEVIGTGAAGPVTTRLCGLFAALTASEGEPVA